MMYPAANVHAASPRRADPDEFLALRNKGLTNAEIARKTGFDASTVRYHIGSQPKELTSAVRNQEKESLARRDAVRREWSRKQEAASPRSTPVSVSAAERRIAKAVSTRVSRVARTTPEAVCPAVPCAESVQAEADKIVAEHKKLLARLAKAQEQAAVERSAIALCKATIEAARSELDAAQFRFGRISKKVERIQSQVDKHAPLCVLAAGCAGK